MIEQFAHHQETLGEALKDVAADDPREAIRRTLAYYTNQQSRMAYPIYRRQGFPLTSSLMESASIRSVVASKAVKSFGQSLAAGECCRCEAT